MWWSDFSSLRERGEFYIYDPQNNTQSDTFRIAPNVYLDVLKQAVRMYFYQRSGFAKAAQHAGTKWSDAAAFLGPQQDTHCRYVNDPGNAALERDLRGGWFDAGDYNKYTVFASTAVTELLLAYEQNASIWTDDYNIPESGNGIPDILDEVKWELDWLLRMQSSDGSVLSKVSVNARQYTTPPSADTTPRYYGKASTSSTAAAAANFAHAALVFGRIGQTAYATTLRNAAIAAWRWAKEHPNVVFDNTGFSSANPEPSGWGIAYGMAMKMLRAASFLYALTGDVTYKSYFDVHYTEAHAIQWTHFYSFEPWVQHPLLYYTMQNDATPTVVADIRTRKVQSLGKAEFFPAYQSNLDAYRAYLNDQDYTWGSNQTKAQMGNIYLDMIRYGLDTANHPAYREAAAGYLHYLHGVNPVGIVYLTNMYAYGAKRAANEMYHAWFWDGSAWDNALTSPKGPAPGYLVGGPNPKFTGTGPNLQPPQNQPVQKAYKDFNTNYPANSWEITEPGIYYQAAYIRLLSAFVSLAVQ